MRHCHTCDAQFPDTQEACLHCGTALHDEIGAEFVLLTSLDPFEARPLLERLSEAGIPFAVLDDREARVRAAGRGRPGSFSGVNIFVAAEVHAQALALQQALVRESLPDLPSDFEPDAASEDACPACASPLAADALTCDECGLEFPDANG